ncbi:Histone deacetylase HDT [Heracleum sosnowskyi]|uniref:Histone deacetylase HDT n=1 Tax=Heracleum sosnowskyi TaxID=360622 RepID=A0AAD8GWG6_9APIA|nr:Histone deacetylase HDT [Heracleum sosnowskyi]
MFHPASMFYGHQLTPSPINLNSAFGDSPDSNSDTGPQRDGPATRLLRQTSSSSTNKSLTKILVHVKVDRSFGPVHVVLSVEDTVGDLIKAVIDVYLKEGRRPVLANTDARCFDLHYSQFSFESLKPDEKLINLVSRNFFLCPKPNYSNSTSTSAAANNSSSCSDEIKTTATTVAADIHAQILPFPCTKFMDFLL